MKINSRLKAIYTRIQNQLFYMIPEKWDRIYLYASVVNRLGNFKTGEMFFYYFPKGVLKRKPVNGYEIPNRFNLEEDEYLKLAVRLYDFIKQLKAEFNKQGEKSWNSLTIKIEKTKFTVEFHYDELPISENKIEAKHILWAYKNLQMPIESFSKKEQKLLLNELEESKNTKEEITTYTEMIYRNPVKNVVQYNKEKTEYISEKEELDQMQYVIKTQILANG